MTTTKVIRLKRWKVVVFLSGQAVNYTVIAVNELDARVIAFCLDNGFPQDTVEIKENHIEVVKLYTKVLGVSSA